LETHRHAQRVGDGEPVAPGLHRQVGIFRELCVELGVGGRHFAIRERYTVQETNYAFCYRAQVVRDVRGEGDDTELFARPVFVFTGLIMLENDLVMLGNEESVQAKQLLLFDYEREAPFEIRRR